MIIREDIPKRHCMVVYASYPWAETRVQRQAEALVKRGYEVDVICCLGLPDEAFIDQYRGVRVYREKVRPARSNNLTKKFLSYFYFFILAMLRLSRLHMRQSYSTVQVHNLPDFLVFCALLPKLQGVSVILDLHDLMPEFYTGRFGPSKRNLLRHLIYWQERLACRFADHVITVSEHWCQTLIKRGVPADKCSVVMNVADEAIFRPLKNYSRHRSCDNGQFRLIYHGTIVQRYGLDLAIRAIDLVKDEIPNIHLTILGRGDHVPELIKMTQELHLANYITIENKIRPAVELPEIIRSATLGIVPYRNDVFTDGLLPTKLMEYAALGLPAIAARTTAIQAYFSNTMVEFFEPDSEEDLAHCICRLYKSPDRLVELAKGSKKFNERNNWSQISRAYITLLERLSNR